MSEEDIETFLAFSGAFDRSTASIFLKNNGHSIERAVNAYLENSNPDQYKTAVVRWDDSQFSGDRHGAQSQIEEVPPFQMDVQNEDDRGRQLQSLTAPSRPPSRNASRASQRTLRGSDVEMVESAQMNGQGVDTEDDMQKAIRMSLQDAQESGIVGSAGHEIVPDVEGAERQRKPGEPAFLKPLPFKDFLPSLITILHTIPGCRSAMLASQDLLLHYGHPGQWWSGESVEVSRTIGPDYDANREGMFDMINEVQRLMAFLDKTTRSYGSAAALARLPALNEPYAMEDHSVRFLKAWRKASAVLQSDSSQQPLFMSQTAPEGQREPDVVHMVTISASDLPTESGETLYDVLDRSLWQGSATGSRPGAWLETVAPVLALRLPAKMLPVQRHSPDHSVDIPGILFADRYHVSNKKIMLEMHRELESAKAGIKSIDEALAKIETFSSSALSKPGNAGDLLSVATKHIQSQFESGDSDMSATEETMSTSKLLARLQAIITQLDSRITALKEQRAHAQQAMRKLGKLLTGQELEAGPQPNMRYHLYGIATVAENYAETFLPCSPPAIVPSLADAAEQHWWHVTYNTGGRGTSALMLKQQETMREVLSTAGKLEESTLLIYANDAVLDTTGLTTDLPDALKDFINTDNAAFQAELADLESSVPRVIPAVPVSFDMLTPPAYEPPPYDYRVMNYDGHADEKTVHPADTLKSGVDDLDGSTTHVQSAAELEEGDTVMTDVDN